GRLSESERPGEGRPASALRDLERRLQVANRRMGFGQEGEGPLVTRALAQGTEGLLVCAGGIALGEPHLTETHQRADANRYASRPRWGRRHCLPKGPLGLACPLGGGGLRPLPFRNALEQELPERNIRLGSDSLLTGDGSTK